MFNFEKLEVWKKAVELCKIINDLTENISQRYQFSIAEQLRRASLSVPTNIAEGAGRKSKKETNCFYNIAKGSTYEVVSLMEVMKRQKLCNENVQKDIYQRSEEIAKMLSGLLRNS